MKSSKMSFFALVLSLGLIAIFTLPLESSRSTMGGFQTQENSTLGDNSTVRIESVTPDISRGNPLTNGLSEQLQQFPEPGFRAQGVVEDEVGNPILNAEIFLRNRFPGFNGKKRWTTLTDANGLFEIAHLPQNLTTLWIKANGFSPGIFPLDLIEHKLASPPTRFILYKGASLDLFVTDTQDNPIPNARLDLFLQPHLLIPDGSSTIQSHTDDAGHALLGNIPAGIQAIEITCDGGGFLRDSLDIPHSGTLSQKFILDFNPENLLLQDGFVQSPVGIPLEGVSVSLSPSNAPDTWTLFSKTNAQGHYFFWLPNGSDSKSSSYRLKFDAGSSGKGHKIFYPGSTPWAMILRPEMSISGFVMDVESNTPLPHAEVAIIGLDESCFSDVMGAFDLRWFPWREEPVSLTFAVNAKGYDPAYPEFKAPNPSNDPLLFLLHASTGRVSGRLLNEDSEPISGAIVQVVSPWGEFSDGGGMSCTSSSDGTFDLTIPGDGGLAELVVTAYGFIPRTLGTNEREGTHAALGDITLSHAKKCRLRVENEYAQPLSGALFSLPYPKIGGTWDVAIPPTNELGISVAFLPKETQSALLYRPGYAPQMVFIDGRMGTQTYVLYEGATIFGSVSVSNTDPLYGSTSASVRLIPTASGPKYIQGGAYVGNKYLSHPVGAKFLISNSAFSISDLPVGEFEIEIKSGLHPIVTRLIKISAAGQSLNLGQIILAPEGIPSRTVAGDSQTEKNNDNE